MFVVTVFEFIGNVCCHCVGVCWKRLLSLSGSLLVMSVATIWEFVSGVCCYVKVFW